jgi:hypothetical protein
MGVFGRRLTSLIRLSVSSLDRFAEVRKLVACLHQDTTMCALCHQESKVHSRMISLSGFRNPAKGFSQVPTVTISET